jgi:hypothetical protein
MFWGHDRPGPHTNEWPFKGQEAPEIEGVRRMVLSPGCGKMARMKVLVDSALSDAVLEIRAPNRTLIWPDQRMGAGVGERPFRIWTMG